MSFMQTAALLGSLAASAYAHGRIVSIDVDGTEYEGFTSAMVSSQDASGIIAWSADNQDNGFVSPDAYGTSDIACHKNGAPGGKAAKIAAGGSLKLQWDTWPESHHGPVIDYMAKCAGDDCSSVTPDELSFFKIDEAGLNDASSQSWASDDLIADGNSWTVTVPESLAPGQYVLRHEIIALHSAQDTNGAQNYPQCINLEVTGSGTAEPEGVAATELYTPTDPGISLSIYNGLTDYEIPGPALWDGASTGGSSSGGSSDDSDDSSDEASSSEAPAATSAAASSDSSSDATTSEAYPEQTGAPTFAGDASATSTSCTTTITLTGSASASATASSAPIDTSDDSSDDSEEDSDSTPTATAPAADISSIASSLPSSVMDAPIPTETSSSDKSDGKPEKALPEGFTLKDLLDWVNYLLSKAMNETGKHARDVTRR